MPATDKIKNITSAAASIRQAQASLMQASRLCSDPVKSAKIFAEYNHLDSALTQLLHTLAITDDAAFSAATTLLKQSAQSFQSDQTQLQAIIDDAKTAASVVSYITQAVGFIMKL